MENKIFDAKDVAVGRVGTLAAKELLKGNSVLIINSEEAIITGNKDVFIERVMKLRKMGKGASMKGPKIIKSSDRLMKRMIRGMLPWDKQKGRDAYKRLKCYIGSGDEQGLKLSEEELKNVKKVDYKLPRKYSKLKEISRLLN